MNTLGLDIGCGENKKQGTVGLDWYDFEIYFEYDPRKRTILADKINREELFTAHQDNERKTQKQTRYSE